MKKSFYLTFLILLLFSCTNTKPDSESSLRKQAKDIAVKYIADKFDEPKEIIEKDGKITITENHTNFILKESKHITYTIDPSKIYTGLIDDDDEKDAIISITSFTGNFIEMPEHLILINTDGKLMLNRAIESYMKIMGIKERIITAEIPTRSPNSPLRDCSVCKEIVKYQFKTGDLIRME
ncbi:MAG TPA: hypothetical protein VMV77_20975 [Bacteroidales bacterium]|nr:hypothetical protein [Bacteroidales bacterium]